MQLEGNPSCRREHCREERPGALGGEEPGGVLNRDEVSLQPHQFLGAFDIVRIRVHGAQCVGHHGVDLHPSMVACLQRGLEVAVVVERVIDGEHGDTEPGEYLGVEYHDVVREQLERVQALPPRQTIARGAELLHNSLTRSQGFSCR